MRKELGEQFLIALAPYKEKRLIISGHGNTDVDSYVSMVMLSNILNQLGFNSKPYLIYKRIDATTLYYLDSMKIPPIVDDNICDDDYVILVDHNAPIESFGRNFYYTNKIIGVIDHHTNVGLLYPANAIEKCGSTASLIYEMFSELIDLESFKSIVLKTLLIDTIGLLSEKASDDDRRFAEKLSAETDLDFEILKKWSVTQTELHLSPEEILKNGFKTHDFKRAEITSSYIESFFETKDDREKLTEVLSYLSKHTSNHVLIVKDLTKIETAVYGIIFGRHVTLNYKGLKSRNNIIKILFDIREKA